MTIIETSEKPPYKPDILDCIASLSTDEVFTPPRIANDILDLLPADIWSNPDIRMLDPCSKTGVFLRESAKRFICGLERAIPNEDDRRKHIFTNMLYGIAITELTGLLSRRTLYCSKDASSKWSVVRYRNSQGNIHFSRGIHNYAGGKCILCGAPQKSIEHGEGRETHAYQFIHKPTQEIFKMKFNVIVGNPPYHLHDAGSTTGSSPIYQKFIQQAKRLHPDHVCMIIPARWYSGGKGLDEFRSSMLNDDQIRRIVDYPLAYECFPGVDISAGICYFHWERGSSGPCEVENKINGQTYKSRRNLNEFSIFVRWGPACKIISKVNEYGFKPLSGQVLSRKPFGLSTKDEPDARGKYALMWKGGLGRVKAARITTGRNIISKFKTVTSRTSFDHGGLPDKNGKRRVISRLAVLRPGTVCTETYLVLGSFDTEQEAKSLESYMKTKLVRFLVAQSALSQDLNKSRFEFVPVVDFNRIWTDQDVFNLFQMDRNEVEFIDSQIKGME